MADAAVWITGTGPDKKLNFRLPTGGKGDKGDKGDTGAAGANGSNVLPTDTAIKERIEDSASATRTALNANYVPVTRDAADTFKNISQRLNFEDYVAGKGSVININHRSDGTGIGNGQAYGFDLHNMPGAAEGFVGHQYSNFKPFMRLDNTDSGTLVSLRNTFNQTLNPAGAATNTSATGNYLLCSGWDGTQFLKITGRGELFITPGADAANAGLEVVGNAASTKRVIKATMNGATHGVELVQNSGATGFYPLLITGYSHGAQMSTSQNGGFVLGITRTATGSGDGINLRNDGTGRSLLFRQGTTEVSLIRANGEYENLTAGNGIYLKSPDGTRYKITVANGGAVSAVAA